VCHILVDYLLPVLILAGVIVLAHREMKRHPMPASALLVVSLLCFVVRLLVTQYQREMLIAELRLTLTKVKRLRGLLPICSSCKKIRDKNDHWHFLETYIREHTDADFTHGICPACAHQLFPEHVRN
jgi:hypothetical protein